MLALGDAATSCSQGPMVQSAKVVRRKRPPPSSFRRSPVSLIARKQSLQAPSWHERSSIKCHWDCRKSVLPLLDVRWRLAVYLLPSREGCRSSIGKAALGVAVKSCWCWSSSGEADGVPVSGESAVASSSKRDPRRWCANHRRLDQNDQLTTVNPCRAPDHRPFSI